MANAIFTLLRNQIYTRLVTDSQDKVESGDIYMQFHAEIEDGYFSGYEYLHGSNPAVGDFEIKGQATYDGEEVTYKLTLIWHDVIDPNFNIRSDQVLHGIAKFFHPDAKDYQIHISWDDVYRVKK